MWTWIKPRLVLCTLLASVTLGSGSDTTTSDDILDVYSNVFDQFEWIPCVKGLCDGNEIKISRGEVISDIAQHVSVRVDQAKLQNKSGFILAPIKFFFPAFPATLEFTFRGHMGAIKQQKTGKAKVWVGPAEVVVNAKLPEKKKELLDEVKNIGKGNCIKMISSKDIDDVVIDVKFDIENLTYKPNLSDKSKPKIEQVLTDMKSLILDNVASNLSANVAHAVDRVPFTCLDASASRTYKMPTRSDSGCEKQDCDSF